MDYVGGAGNGWSLRELKAAEHREVERTHRVDIQGAIYRSSQLHGGSQV
jgi:hypothetical protein